MILTKAIKSRHGASELRYLSTIPICFKLNGKQEDKYPDTIPN
jgi:hypothetical protein